MRFFWGVRVKFFVGRLEEGMMFSIDCRGRGRVECPRESARGRRINYRGGLTKDAISSQQDVQKILRVAIHLAE